ncbi:hypothetical protein ACFRJ8_14975 [Arthrobacter sp. NPDC056886]|uniref:hypothetical protein n=1 Tax=Arthrobacter sp. NPDC056886 TaxID=3345960 RepID=UPI00366C487E
MPEAAVEAAAGTLHESWYDYASPGQWQEIMRAALEAAAPHMLRDAKAEAWDECEAAKYEIRLNQSGNAWEPVKDNPYR